MFVYLIYFMWQLQYGVQGADTRKAKFRRQCLQTNVPGVQEVSVVACSKRCLEKISTCKGFIFDSDTNMCTLVEGVNYTTCAALPVESHIKSYIRMEPPVIYDVTIDQEVTASFRISGIALTSEGDLAVVEHALTQAALYTSNLVYKTPLIVNGAIRLFDIASGNGILYMTDLDENRIHVLRENGTYLHKIHPGFNPTGIEVFGNYLFVTCYDEHRLYKLELGPDFKMIGNAQMIIDQQLFNGIPVPEYPFYVRIRHGKIVFSNQYSVALANMAGEVEWVTRGNGTLTSGQGVFNQGRGVEIDAWGRIYVADCQNKRVQLIAADGTYIQDLVTNESLKMFGVLVVGDNLYVTEIITNKLVKYTLHYVYGEV